METGGWQNRSGSEEAEGRGRESGKAGFKFLWGVACTATLSTPAPKQPSEPVGAEKL